MSWLTCLVVCVFVVGLGRALPMPTRSRFSEMSTSEPAPVTGGEWDEAEDFDLDGDEDWLGESAASPSSIPVRQDYEYDGDSSSRDDDEEQDAEEEETNGFVFAPATDTRLMLQDDDAEQSGLIKVRHTGKNSYTEVDRNSLDPSSSDDDDDEQFEFTLGNDDDDDLEKDDFVLEDTKSSARKSDDEDLEKDDDFVLEETKEKDDDEKEDDLEQQRRRKDDEDDLDDDDDDNSVFDSPEEDSQVIYGDHVFLY